MNYELANQLKDAAFPQFNEDAASFYYCTSRLYKGHETEDCKPYVIYGSQGWVDSVLVRCPTLSELIEACGERFSNLANFGEENEPWIARSVGYPNSIRTRGSTPEEAVANLWLALNKKD